MVPCRGQSSEASILFMMIIQLSLLCKFGAIIQPNIDDNTYFVQLSHG